MSEPNHLKQVRSDSFMADLQRGFKYAIARRAKFLSTVTGLVAFAVSTGLLHGEAETAVNTFVGILTAILTYQIPNAAAVGHGPEPHERALEKGNPGE